MSEAILEMRNISKRFPGVKALDNVSFDLRAGEVHVLIGENGAGKSTLMKVLNGVYPADEGEIFINKIKKEIRSPMQARALGIGTVYQELTVLPYLSAGENIFLGRLPKTRLKTVAWRQIFSESQSILDKLGVPVQARALVGDLSVATKQMIEIAKILTRDAKIIIFDEPTSSLSTPEVERLFELIRRLKDEGVGIIYISHKLDELYEIGDRITIMKDGAKVATVENFAKTLTRSDLIGMMVGRKLTNLFNKQNIPIGAESLRVEKLSSESFRDVSIVAHSGEVVGISGLVGSGRTEVAMAIYGADPQAKGEIYIRGKRVKIDSPQTAISYGIGLITEDRKEKGLILDQSVRENITLPSIRRYLDHGVSISRKKENDITSRCVQDLNIKTPSNEQKVVNLSGGNQQKVVIGKWLSADAQILIMDEPTRGIDVGAKNEVYELMSELLKKGVTILMISSEMQEILGMSDRVYVMHEGNITAELTREELSEEVIMYDATLDRDCKEQEGRSHEKWIGNSVN